MSKWGGPTASKIDAYFSLAVGFLALAIAALLVVPASKKDNGDKPICAMAIDISWPNVDADVDLWAEAPNDRPVGYSSKSSKTLDLVRDDLGYLFDTSAKNEERVCARTIVAGEYTVNVHMFAIRGGISGPIPVRISVNKVDVSSATMVEIVSKDVQLTRLGQELTVVRFTLKEDGTLVPGSEHDIPKPLRTANVGNTFGSMN